MEPGKIKCTVVCLCVHRACVGPQILGHSFHIRKLSKFIRQPIFIMYIFLSAEQQRDTLWSLEDPDIVDNLHTAKQPFESFNHSLSTSAWNFSSLNNLIRSHQVVEYGCSTFKVRQHELVLDWNVNPLPCRNSWCWEDNSWKGAGAADRADLY